MYFDVLNQRKKYESAFAGIFDTLGKSGQPGYFFRKEQLIFLAKRGHPAAMALALIVQPLPLARKGHPVSLLRRGQSPELKIHLP
jgi:hypothetical protein